MTNTLNRYAQIIEAVFLKYYSAGAEEVSFDRSDLIQAANALKIKTPKNIGDILYSFRYRTTLPQRIVEKAPENKLDDNFDASPALVDKQIILRGHKYTYCIEEK